MLSTLPLSLRRSTINVENVGVRLWQSSAICLRAFARSAIFNHCYPTPRRAKHAPPPWNHPRKLCLRGARWAVGITCTLHSNKKRGPAPFFLNTVCVYPTTVSQQSWCHAFVAAQGVYDTTCLGRVQIHNAYFVHVTFLDDDGVAIFHHTGRQ